MAAESRLRRRQRAAAAVGVVAIVEQAGGRTAVVAARVAAALVRVFAILIEGQSQRQIGVQFVVEQLECQTIARRTSEERRVGKEWSVRVYISGRRIIKKKKNKKQNNDTINIK